MTMYDWMHIFLVGGLLDNELGQCMYALRQACAPTTYAILGDFVNRFRWPGNQAPAKKLFDADAIKKHEKSRTFTCTASELLSLVPVLAYYFVAVALEQGVCPAHVRSLIALLDAVELVAAVRTGVVSPDQLKEVNSRHLELFKAAYGEDNVVPKHHFAQHLWRMLQRFGCLLSCFTMERLHKLCTKYAKPRHNTTSYEIGLIEEITCDRIFDLRNGFLSHGLEEPKVPCGAVLRTLQELYPERSSYEVSRILRTPTGRVLINDVVYVRIDGALLVAEIFLHFCLDGCSTCSMISVWPPAPRAAGGSVSGHIARHKMVHNPVVVASSAIEVGLIHARAAGHAIICVPVYYR